MTSTIRRRLAATAAPALLALTLTACGGTDAGGAPTDASVEDFCNAFAADAEFNDPSIDQIHDYADKLAEVGTPSEISGDARAGFEAFVSKVADLSDSDLDGFENAESSADIFGEDDADNVDAFIAKTAEVCADSLS